MIRKNLALLILSVLVLSCSSSKFAWKDGAGSADGDGVQHNEEFDPLVLDDDDIVVPVVDRVEKGSAPEKIESRSDTTVADFARYSSEMVTGFRVQLLATQDADNAREEQRSAIFKFQERVYLEYESAMYKLRVGENFTALCIGLALFTLNGTPLGVSRHIDLL